MTYPSPDEHEYEHVEWEPPEHECVFLKDNMKEAGVRDAEGNLRVYEVYICNQCPNTKSVKTNRLAEPPKR